MNNVKKKEVNSNYYLIDDMKYVRVTKVIDVISKPELYRWFAKYGSEFCENKMNNAKESGSRFHKIAADYIRGKKININVRSKRMKALFDNFKTWYDTSVSKNIAVEQTLLDDKYLYGGTADFIGTIDGKYVLADWKTGNRIYPSYYLQLAAYVHMWELNNKDELDGAMIVLVKENKVDIEFISKNDLKKYYDVFLCALKIWRWRDEVM